MLPFDYEVLFSLNETLKEEHANLLMIFLNRSIDFSETIRTKELLTFVKLKFNH